MLEYVTQESVILILWIDPNNRSLSELCLRVQLINDMQWAYMYITCLGLLSVFITVFPQYLDSTTVYQSAYDEVIPPQ